MSQEIQPKKVEVEEEESTSRYEGIQLSLEDRNTVSNGQQLNNMHITDYFKGEIS